MRRVPGGAGTGRVLAAAACVLLVGADSTGVAAVAQRKHSPTNLLINAQEWSLWPSRSRVPAGTVYVELWNRGQDMHDTIVRRLNAGGQMAGPIVARVKVTLPGKVSDATWHLKPGRYELYCSMPGHLQLGMQAKLTVTR